MGQHHRLCITRSQPTWERYCQAGNQDNTTAHNHVCNSTQQPQHHAEHAVHCLCNTNRESTPCQTLCSVFPSLCVPSVSAGNLATSPVPGTVSSCQTHHSSHMHRLLLPPLGEACTHCRKNKLAVTPQHTKNITACSNPNHTPNSTALCHTFQIYCSHFPALLNLHGRPQMNTRIQKTCTTSIAC
jgi:hypothetical protein